MRTAVALRSQLVARARPRIACCAQQLSLSSDTKKASPDVTEMATAMPRHYYEMSNQALLQMATLGDQHAREERLIPAIVEDLLPPGFEIEAVVRPEDAGNTGVYSWLDNIREPRVAEARDDRFVAALDLRNRRAERIAYVVRAVTPGTYTLPGAVVEDMYRPDTFGRSATGRVVIAPRG